ncbi:hypothetical protein BD413DRAFT_680923 [Trametes elegans]|nr:hypothetical protein BD413DRAFT_680923 [Trametes elegans]
MRTLVSGSFPMSASIRSPWILNYLIAVAEQYGANLVSVPRVEKASRAQLIKFLTFAPPDSSEPCAIWTEVSDKEHWVLARLTRDAIERHMKDPRHKDQPITSNKTALVRLIKFRVAFGRVARSGTGMTEHPRLYLDVDELEVLGAYGEPTWGSPVAVHDHPDIREWYLGLLQDGGGGNVLKLRKEQSAALAVERTNGFKAAPASEVHQQTVTDAMNIKVRVARKSAAPRPRPSSDAVNQQPIASKDAVRRASWKRLHMNMLKYMRPPDAIFKQLLQLCGESKAQRGTDHFSSSPKPTRPCSGVSVRISSASSRTPSPAARQSSSPARTPSTWSPSTRGSPRPHHGSEGETSESEGDIKDDLVSTTRDRGSMSRKSSIPEAHDRDHSHDDPMEVDFSTDQEHKAASSSSLLPPPPAQSPRPQLPPSSLPTIPYATSPRASSPTREYQTNDYRDMDTLPPSSLPAPSYPRPPSPTSSPRQVPSTPAYPAHQAVRRVPLPQCNLLRRDPDASGEGRVLVENSDTASPGSQQVLASQSQSQSQCHISSHGAGQSDGDVSQSQIQPPSQSQVQRPSQLRNKLEVLPHSDVPPAPGPELGANDHEQKPQAEEEQSQESQQQIQYRSQQSLSYKGDSQSQEEPQGQAPSAPGPVAEQPHQDHDLLEAQARVNVDDGMPASMHRHFVESAVEESSAMAVDEDPPADPTAVSEDGGEPGPLWAAIKTTDEPVADSLSEIDELVSDSQDTPEKQATASRSRPRPECGDVSKRSRADKAHEGDSGSGLDSDDARTAATVERYMAKAAETTGMRPDRSSTMTHDPSVWAAPTFMQKGNAKEASSHSASAASSEVKLEKVSPKKLSRSRAPELKNKKRRAPSPSEPDESPVKRRRTSKGAAPTPAPAPAFAPTRQDTVPPATRALKPVSQTTTESALRARDSTASARSVPPTSSTAVHSGMLSASGSSVAGISRGLGHVDLRAAPRPSSRASSRVPRGQEEQAARSRRATPAPPRERGSSSSSRAQATTGVSDRAKEHAVSRTSVARTVSSAASSRAQGASRTKAVASSSGAIVAPSTVREEPATVLAPLLGGYELSLELTRTPGGPPLLGWNELQDILLATGRYRANAHSPSG